MTHRLNAISGGFPALLLAALLWFAPTGQAVGVDIEILTPSESPRELSGEGDREFVVEGPFSLAWQSAGGRFSVEATAEGAERPSAASATQGKGQGRLKLRGAQRYRVAIAADGRWTATVSW